MKCRTQKMTGKEENSKRAEQIKSIVLEMNPYVRNNHIYKS